MTVYGLVITRSIKSFEIPSSEVTLTARGGRCRCFGQISERVRRPVGMLIYRRVRAIQDIAVDTLVQENLIRPVAEVYD